MWFMREHLLGSYDWPGTVESAKYTGGPSRRAFNRFNGEQVLFLINFYGSVSEQSSIHEGRKMETLFLHHLPTGNLSEISVFNWLRDMFNTIPEKNIKFSNQDHQYDK